MYVVVSIEVKEISPRAIRQWLNKLSLTDLDVKQVHIADYKGDFKDILERDGLQVM